MKKTQRNRITDRKLSAFFLMILVFTVVFTLTSCTITIGQIGGNSNTDNNDTNKVNISFIS